MVPETDSLVQQVRHGLAIPHLHFPVFTKCAEESNSGVHLRGLGREISRVVPGVRAACRGMPRQLSQYFHIIRVAVVVIAGHFHVSARFKFFAQKLVNDLVYPDILVTGQLSGFL